MKLTNVEILSMLAFLVIFLTIIALHLSVFSTLFRSQKRALARLMNLSSDKPEEEGDFGEWLRDTLPKIGALLVPKEEDKRILELKADLLRAGMYNRKALRVFMGGKLVLMLLLPILLGLLPFGDREFDLVCAFDVIEHVENDRLVFGEVSRVLKQDGVLMFSVPVHAQSSAIANGENLSKTVDGKVPGFARALSQ